MIGVFGVELGEVSKAGPYDPNKHPHAQDGRFAEVAGEHKGALVTAGALAVGIGTHNVNATRRFTAGARHVGDPARAAHLAEVLRTSSSGPRNGPAAARSIVPHVKDWEMFDGMSGGKAETRHFADHPLTLRPHHYVVAPRKAAKSQTAATFTRLIDASDAAKTPHLYRGVNIPKEHLPKGHQVGDVVDMGRLASFSGDRSVAAQFARGEYVTPMPTGHAAVYHVPAGSAKGVRIAPVMDPTKHFAEEWLAGGKYKVTSVTHDPRNSVSHYTLAPHTEGVGKSAFGVWL